MTECEKDSGYGHRLLGQGAHSYIACFGRSFQGDISVMASRKTIVLGVCIWGDLGRFVLLSSGHILELWRCASLAATPVATLYLEDMWNGVHTKHTYYCSALVPSSVNTPTSLDRCSIGHDECIGLSQTDAPTPTLPNIAAIHSLSRMLEFLAAVRIRFDPSCDAAAGVSAYHCSASAKISQCQ